MEHEESPALAPYRYEIPSPSTNGHRPADAPVRERRLRGFAAGAAAGMIAASLLIPRLSLLNLALFNPWVRPVIAGGIAGAATGALRRGRVWTAAAFGAAAALVSLEVVYATTRIQWHVLFVGRSAARVIAADAARLAAYAIPPGALGGASGWSLRAWLARARA